MEEVHRYETKNVVASALNPLEDVTCWVEGLTSPKYVKDLLKSRHSLQGTLSVHQRSEAIASLVHIACRYLEQAAKGPKDVSYLPLYYACLNLSKAYIVIGPYGHELSQNRRHGASYDTDRDFNSLDDDCISLWNRGTIPLFYRTLVAEDMFQNTNAPLTLRMRDIYPYIKDISAEYSMATGCKSRLIPFGITIADSEQKQRLVATCVDVEEANFNRVAVGTLQAFRGLRREKKGSDRLVSKWYAKDDTTSIRASLRPAILYDRCLGPSGQTISFVPSSSGNLLLPEELPLICALYHMSSVVRYNPDGLRKLADSKYWPTLLTLRTHGLYRFLLLFWSFVNQCCWYIVPP